MAMLPLLVTGTTMLRIFSGRFAFSALVLATCSFSGLAETPTALDGPVAAAPATDNNFLPMRFELLSEGPTDACTGPCRQLITAAGMITADTARQFLAFGTFPSHLRCAPDSLRPFFQRSPIYLDCLCLYGACLVRDRCGGFRIEIEFCPVSQN